MRLRLYHHSDGARVAYREYGAGPPLALLHSALLSHKEWEPAVEQLADRFRVVLPDLPLHGDSERSRGYPYTPDWFADVLGGFCAEVMGAQPLLAGHEFGAELLLHALERGTVSPARVVLMPSRLHGVSTRPRSRAALQLAARAGAVPGVAGAMSHVARLAFRPKRGVSLTVRANPDAADLMRHSFVDLPGDAALMRARARWAKRWPRHAQTQLLELYPRLQMPVLLLWADQDAMHPLTVAEEALARLPRGQLRVLESTGFLIAYDDPVGLARELAAFCG